MPSTISTSTPSSRPRPDRSGRAATSSSTPAPPAGTPAPPGAARRGRRPPPPRLTQRGARETGTEHRIQPPRSRPRAARPLDQRRTLCELSMRQVEVSRTLVFDDPRRARGFFEALVTDNIGIGRPEEVHAVFGRNRRGRTTPLPFATRVFSPGTDVKMDFRYKHSRVKQYLKEG